METYYRVNQVEGSKLALLLQTVYINGTKLYILMLEDGTQIEIRAHDGRLIRLHHPTQEMMETFEPLREEYDVQTR